MLVQMTVALSTPPVKPRLRGVLHEVAAVAALLACAGLAGVAPSTRARMAALVYGMSVAVLFAASALYHRPTWAVSTRQILRRVDHSAIFLLIAGTYTPFCLLLGSRRGLVLLVLVWTGALLGIIRCIAWVNAPKALSALLYVALGWMVLPVVPELRFLVGTTGIALLAAGGITYTVGAVIYAMRWPDPFPRVFGYHEVFHALVVVAAVLHFVVVVPVIRSLR
jgi:hemolysin III